MISFERMRLVLLVKRRRATGRVRSWLQQSRRAASRLAARFALRLANRIRHWRLVWRAAALRGGRAFDEIARVFIRRAIFAAVLAAVLGVLGLALWRGGWFKGVLERGGEAAHDEQRRLYWALGWPLPGTPDLARLDQRLAEKGLSRGAPVFIRIFKREHELELWMKQGDQFVLFTTYPVCRFSGGLGPKLQTGDRQAPEGFYAVGRSQLNPNSRWRRAFNVGFPNLFDRSHGRTGSDIMVHGGCSSIGCYAMTNPVIEEIWDLTTAAMDRGQKRFALHVFPFRMTEEKLARRQGDPWLEFWGDLKKGYDLFEHSHRPPRVSVCQGRYALAPGDAGDGAGDVKSGCRNALHRELWGSSQPFG
jgi:murein L,D-transpeptidase YafK